MGLQVINSDNVWEDGLHTFGGFASDVGMAPGVVPPQLKTELGNKKNLQFVKANAGVFIYRQLLGCIEVHILND